jgi:thiamine biosynthesis lipoprotein
MKRIHRKTKNRGTLNAGDLPLVKFPFKAMGSPCEIQLYGTSRSDARSVARMAIADVERLEQRYSRYRSDSFLSEINRVAATGGGITVDDETAGLLNYASTCYEQSDGLFDITSGILRRAWNFKSGVLPDEKHIQNLLDHIGWHKVRWKPPYLEFAAGMELDFGGIVKEYAVDRLAALCWNKGIHHGLVNLGGDVRIIGPHPDGNPWHIGIQHPRQKETAIETIALHRGGVASSGDYERCITVNGVRYGHILNPKTGWPVRHMAAVTVVGDFCVVSGSACTIAMLKEKEGPAWLQTMGLPYFWVDVQGNTGGTLATRGIQS